MLLCNIAHSIICTRLFRGKMHSDWFSGIDILQGIWQHGEKVGYCYPSGLKKTLCKCDFCPTGHERINDAGCVQILQMIVTFVARNIKRASASYVRANTILCSNDPRLCLWLSHITLQTNCSYTLAHYNSVRIIKSPTLQSRRQHRYLLTAP
jgi:hypothetical protein